MTRSAAISSIEDVFERYGVSLGTLAPLEREALDRDGYVVLANVVGSNWLARMRAAFEEECGAGDAPSNGKETGTRHFNDLFNCDEIFDGVFTEPRVLAAIHHVLGCAFRLGAAGGRDPMPGFGQQGLHADWVARAKGEAFRIVTAIWMLDDFTETNGPTRVVPGSHHLPTTPPKSFADPAATHPRQKLITAQAGSVLVFNGHLWHSGTRNTGKIARRALQCVFVARDEFRFASAKVNNPDRFAPACRYILGQDLGG